MLILSRSEVERLLDLDELIEALAAAMSDLSAGRASSPPRVAAQIPERAAFLGAMPARVPSSDALTSKLVSVFPQNATLPTHQAVIAAFDPQTGEPTAFLDGTAITALRTAAGSARATGAPAPEDPRTRAILPSSDKASAHKKNHARVR